MGLIAPDMDRDVEALICAVERFLDTAPAVQAIGDALYPRAVETASEEEPEVEDEADDPDTVSPANRL